jgi:hypothetical protein
MKATVVWTQDAMNQLANAWLNAADRASVTNAADRIDAHLKQDSDSSGVPYDDHTLLLIVRPLVVRYEFQAMDNLVIVVGLRVLRSVPPQGES